jgi:galactokinase
VRAVAPGRVNLIGEHTDHTGGLVLPMAIDRVTAVDGDPGGDVVRLVSTHEREPAVVPLVVGDPRGVAPPWARYVAGVVAATAPAVGFTGTVSSTIPIGAGLSSSAALEVAVALALGFRGPVDELAVRCQEAEHRATGVPCGIMDQLASAAGVAGHALLIDCTTLAIRPVPIPEGVEVTVVDSGERRPLAGTAYGERRRSCEAAQARIGPLRDASPEDVDALADPVLRACARHVVTENQRVRDFVAALEAGDLAACGALLAASHASLRDDLRVSTPRLDALVDRLAATPGVFGARLTGGGFGGCAVALSEPGALREGWTVRARDGARVLGAG